MNVFFYLSSGVTEILSVGLSDQYNSFVGRFFIHLMAAGLLLLNQEVICHVQLVTTCES